MIQLDLRFALWNGNGLTQHRDEVESFIKNNNLDMLLVSETHFNVRSHFRIRGFDIIKCDRPDGAARGGAAIIIKSNLIYDEMTHYSTEGIQVATIKIKLNNRNIAISAIYCRPKDNLKVDDYKQIFDSIGSGPFIAGGDYNAKHTFWGARICTVKGRELLKCVQDRRYTTISTGTPTYWPARLNTMPDLLDFFVCSQIGSNQLIVEPSFDLSSDHSPIIAVLHSVGVRNKQIPRVNLLKFKRNVEPKIDTQISLRTHVDLETAANNLLEVVQESMNESVIPMKPYTSHVSLLIRNKINEKRRLKQIYQSTLFPGDKTNLNRANKELKKLLAQYEEDKLSDYLYELKPNGPGDKNLWNATKFVKRPAIRRPPILDPDGVTWVKTSKEKAEKFANFLENQFTPFPSTNDDSDVAETLQSPLQMDLPIRPITLNELKTEIKNLNNKKAPGHDGVTSVIIKSLPENAIILLLFLFNAILRLGHFPSAWKNSVVIMILKPGKPEHLLSSYRPISLISIFSKLFEKLFKSRLSPLFDPPDHQFGFRFGHGTIEQCHRFVHHIQKALQEKKFSCGAFLDIQQAFDRVWHDGLLYKVKTLLPSPFFPIIQSYLSNRKFLVRYGDEQSGWKNVKAGVPQGSVLGPTLYTMYTSDMPVDESCLTGTFADDTGYLCTNEDIVEAKRQLQMNLTNFENWANKWRLKASVVKSQVITFTLRPEPQLSPLLLYGAPIPEVNKVKYLGLTLDKKLNFKEHIEDKKKQVSLTIIKYDWLVGRRSSLSLENKILIYKTIIRPMWAYCCTLWGAASNSNIKKIQVLQNKFLRNAINAPWYVSGATNHRDLEVEYVTNFINKSIDSYKERLSRHESHLVSSVMGDTIPRRLKRRIILDQVG